MAKRNNGRTRADAAAAVAPHATTDGGAVARKVNPTGAARKGKGRSGGAVDAPGKKHRKQAPPDPGATSARSQAGKLRAAMPMAKTNRPRGRG